jgi:hypothetical protein
MSVGHGSNGVPLFSSLQLSPAHPSLSVDTVAPSNVSLHPLSQQPYGRADSELSSPASTTPSANQSVYSSPSTSVRTLDGDGSHHPTLKYENPLTFANLELLALGLPSSGARTRVETQLKVSLVLVQVGAGVDKSSLVTSSGDLADDVGQRAARVGVWPWLKLPKWSALKRHARRHYRQGTSILFSRVCLSNVLIQSKQVSLQSRHSFLK